mmetsp:Transcript_37319/g.101027  ORF Transcript_37319/g.101027 Transcript_37319/m.101027 type:complete len:245 (+) Transcript_37319:550-1284(+)
MRRIGRTRSRSWHKEAGWSRGQPCTCSPRLSRTLFGLNVAHVPTHAPTPHQSQLALSRLPCFPDEPSPPMTHLVSDQPHLARALATRYQVGDGSMSLPLDKPPGWTLHEGQSAGRGVAVSMVAEASNAEKMGVRPGWKLQSIGGVNVYCAADVHAALAEAMRKNQSHIVVKFQGKRGEGAPQCLHLNPMEEPGFCGSKWEMTPNMPPAVEKVNVLSLLPPSPAPLVRWPSARYGRHSFHKAAFG